MTKRMVGALVASLALVGACKDSTGVPDLNNVSAETLKGGLTRSSAQLLTLGLLNQHRGSTNGNYIVFGETMARDAWRMDKAENRYVLEFLSAAAPDAGAFTGQGVFSPFFVGIRAANTLITATSNATDASGLDAAERSGVLGIARTTKALLYWNVLEHRDSVGMPIDLDRDINAEPAPWVCKPDVMEYISALLDSAYADLNAAGAEFAVNLPSGFAGVADTPAGFAEFNRGIKAKVEIYRALSRQKPAGNTSLNAAVTALAASFMDPTATTPDAMQAGVYHVYSTASGDATNSLVDAALHLTPAVRDSILPGDARASKIVTAGTPYTMTVTISGSPNTTLSTPYDFSATLSQPIPILKNEELLLLRAQAAIELNDLATALTYLNYVHTAYGLAPYTAFADQNAARNALLYEKRYSLLMDGPQRLVDLRAYDRLNAASFHAGTASSPLPGDIFTQALPVPINELNARGGSVGTIQCK